MIENNAGETLLLLDSRTFYDDWEPWDFPGGRMNDGESFLQTLTRELQEEIGIENFNNAVHFKTILSTHEITLKDGRKLGLVLVIYKVKIDDKTKIVLSDEHNDHRWADKLELKKLLEQGHKYPRDFINGL